MLLMVSISWKKEKNLKVTGSMIKQGVFRGWQSASRGGIKAHDIPTNFTSEYIDKIYNNVNGHIPISVDHGNGDIVGYTYEIGITSDKDDLPFKGFVFSESAKNKIIREGYTFVSPEIVEETDSFGNVTPTLVGIALVKNPAISGTDISIEPIVFSAGEPEMTDEEITVTATDIPDGDVDKKQESGFGRAPKPDKTDREPINVNITLDGNALGKTYEKEPVRGNDVSNSDLEQYKAKNDELAAKIDKLLTERYDGIVAELKRQGIDDPGKLVRDLPVENKIDVLSRLMASMVKTKPVAKPADAASNQTPGPNKTEIDTAVSEVLAELGYTVDEYRELRGET